MMIEITIPEWMGWIICVTAVAHAIKSLLEITVHATAKQLLEDGLVDQFLEEMRKQQKDKTTTTEQARVTLAKARGE